MALHKKLLEVQEALKDKIVFDATNPHFKNEYISLGGLLKAVLPELHKRNILLMQPLTAYGEKPAVLTRFIDTDTDEMVGEYTVLVLEKETPQAMGSAITYTRRYSILSFLGLCADEDDDAESATVQRKPATKAVSTSSASF